MVEAPNGRTHAGGRHGHHSRPTDAARRRRRRGQAALTLYGLTYDGSNDDLLGRLGPHSTGKGCLYLKRLEDVDRDVLTELVRRSFEANHEQPC